MSTARHRKANFLPLSEVVSEHLKDPEYRRAYFLHRFILDAAVTVKKLREAKHISQAELARKVGMPQSALARLEGAKDKRAPRAETLYRIADALGVEIFIRLPPGASDGAPVVSARATA